MDRQNCMAVERGISVLELYEHMKKFLTTASNHGGSRRDGVEYLFPPKLVFISPTFVY